MILHPEAQVAAQEEIDRVVGFDRLPNLSDRASLPYVECLLQEVYRCVARVQSALSWRLTMSYRWQCPVPLGRFVLWSTLDKFMLTSIPRATPSTQRGR